MPRGIPNKPRKTRKKRKVHAQAQTVERPKKIYTEEDVGEIVQQAVEKAMADQESNRKKRPISPIPGFDFNGITRRWQSETLSQTDANEKQVGGDHYKDVAIQPWDLAVVLELPFLDATAISMLLRWRKKNGIEDLRKAIHYVEKMIEIEQVMCETVNIRAVDGRSPATPKA